MPTQPAIIAALDADPSLSALSDADAAARLDAPVLRSRPGRITLTTLAASAVWGFAKAAAFRAAIAQAAGAGNASAAALLDILAGDGFDASDPQAAQMAPAFVGLGGGAITTDDATAALYLPPTYRAGALGVTEADVTVARATIAARAGYQSARQLAADQYNSLAAFLDQQQAAGAVPPSSADVLARLGAQQAGG